MTHPLPVPVTQLPDAIRTYLTTHEQRDVDGALAAFAPTAEVVDQGETFSGTAAVRTFLATAGAEFSYTTTVLGAERVDDATSVVRVRIEGDFPGGVADLRYVFEMSGELVRRLEIGS